MAWNTLIFIDAITHNADSSRIYSEETFANLQRHASKLTGSNISTQQDRDPKHMSMSPRFDTVIISVTVNLVHTSYFIEVPKYSANMNICIHWNH